MEKLEMRRQQRSTRLSTYFSLILAALSLMLSNQVLAQSKPQEAPSKTKPTPCLEKKLTPENSYLQDFGGGAVLRIPRCLIPGLKIKDPQKPIKAGSLSMVFWFPDMTLTMWKSPMDYFLDEAGHKKYTPNRNRFRVNIISLFYTKSNYPGDPTPHQIEKNMAVGGKYAVTKIPTPYPGLMAEVSTKWFKSDPSAATKFNPMASYRYSEESNSPYDLFMQCGPPAKALPGDNCRTYVLEKKHDFEYFMYFPDGAIAHTDQLIRSINKLINRWWVR